MSGPVPPASDNERTRLAANALDRASTACLAVGIFARLSAATLGSAHVPLLGIVVSFAGWLAAAIMPHMAARRVPED
ncbi:MAG: hypothetical protein QM699_13600 [Amaricoccus sp.]|uniref:hypothetical protein n=1 Tax=Amaricoccus sp. TaxID=1872485 RepID=UPI0039E60E34